MSLTANILLPDISPCCGGIGCILCLDKWILFGKGCLLMTAFFDALMSYPVIVFSAPFCLFFALMLIDLLFDLSDGSLGDIDGVDIESGWSAKLLLPPIVSQVPLPVALTVSTFVATVLTYYLQCYLFGLLSGVAFYAVTIPALFVIYYLCRIHYIFPHLLLNLWLRYLMQRMPLQKFIMRE